MAPANFARKNPQSPRDSGFTMVELLITVVIVAIIAAISLPAVARSAVSQRDDVAENSVQAISLAQSAVFAGQRSYVSLTDLRARKLVNGVVKATVLLGPNGSCYTALAVSKNGVPYISEAKLEPTELTTDVTSTCARENDLRTAMTTLGADTAGRTDVSYVNPVAGITYRAGAISWPAVAGATSYGVERYDSGTWTLLQTSASTNFLIAAPVDGTGIRLRVVALNGSISATPTQFILTMNQPGNLLKSGDMQYSAGGWTLNAAQYVRVESGTPGHVEISQNGSLTQQIPVTASTQYQISGSFGPSVVGTGMSIAFTTAANAPISTITITGDEIAAGRTFSTPAGAAKATVQLATTAGAAATTRVNWLSIR